MSAKSRPRNRTKTPMWSSATTASRMPRISRCIDERTLTVDFDRRLLIPLLGMHDRVVVKKRRVRFEADGRNEKAIERLCARVDTLPEPGTW